MRLLALLAAAVGSLLVANGAQAAEPRWPDGARYDLALAFDAGRRALTGTEDVTFVNTGPAPLERVWLRVWANGPSGCTRPLARVDVESGGTAGATAAGCTALRVDLPAPLEPGASATVRLRLDVRVPPRNDRFGRSGGAYLLGNAIPVLAPEDVAGPRLVPYSGLGDSFYSLTAAWRLVLDVPAGLEVAATGTETAPREPLPDGGWRIVSEAPAARDLAIAVGPFAVATRQVGNVEVRVLRLRGAKPAVGARLHAPGRARRREVHELVRPSRRATGSAGAARRRADALRRVRRHGVPRARDGRRRPGLRRPRGRAPVVLRARRLGRVAGAVARREPRDVRPAPAARHHRLLRPAAAARALAGRAPRRRPWRPTSGSRSCTAPCTTAEPVRSRRCARAWGDRRFTRLLRTWVLEHRMGVATTADFAALVRRLAPPRFKVVRWFERSRLDVSAASQ